MHARLGWLLCVTKASKGCSLLDDRQKPPVIRMGDEEVLPYPQPSSAAATRMGRGNVRAGTRPEWLVRRALHRKGLRYRVDYPIHVGLPRVVRVDIAFTRARLAVFVDGCFWHGCPDHFRMPSRNTTYWRAKLRVNRERDSRVDGALAAAGWTVIRVWEHAAPEEAADAIARRYRELSGR